MTNQSTMDKLIEMRLSAMADAFRNQLADPRMKEGLLRCAYFLSQNYFYFIFDRIIYDFSYQIPLS